ncbi:unnamed protein product [Ceutorhynchus assimilis]|uniref:Chitin-binding type-2 domain-containing protein n=1 Tax=Ceutorhynchus assimilis TaxID=467358 RepID=A0A9P0DKD0_9CUCU|nr:unnamed protein product [Ceutorhynchus assimilis]
MERYHILKLGLAITFYAAYCIRPMLVYSLEADNELDNNHYAQNTDHEFFQYFQGVEGRPGLDFPVYSFIPRTPFSCKGIESGYYADLDTNCQVFHICEEGKKVSFLCPNGTIFQQSDLICEWWNKVNCTDSPSLYASSAERLQNDNARRKSGRRVPPYNDAQKNNHGAVMRMEERSSVRATKNGKDYPVNPDIDLRIRNHRIPDNNDIEQQIEQAESNNRHLANNFNNLQQTRHPNHNYDNYQTTSKSKQYKKDIDKETGNYINNNYGQAEPRRNSKRVEHNQKNSFDYSSKNNVQEKSTTLKEYHVQFGSTSAGTDSATEQYSRNTGFRSTARNYQQQQSQTSNHFNQNTNNEKTFGARTSPRVQQTALSTTFSPSTYRNVQSSTTPVTTTTTEEEFPYGSGIKEKFQSYDARTLKPNQQKSRGSVKYNVLANYGQSIPVTTYSPSKKYAFNNQNDKNEDFALPPFPKHKSEQTNSISPGQIPVYVTQNSESDETQIPQESSSFVKNSFNSITDNSFKTSPSPYPNHRSTYSDIKEFSSLLEPPKISSISSITPHLVTTQPINNGKPFVGSRVGNTLPPNHPTTQSKYTYLPTTTNKPTVIFGVLRHSTTEATPYGPPQPVESTTNNLFNVGNTDKTLPTIETTTAVTNAIPTETFNIGSTDTTLTPNIVPKQTTVPPFRINIPEHGSLNVGQNSYEGQKPVDEPPFVKKTVPLLYNGQKSTERTVDRATVYGSYSSSTQRSKNTPYSPTVPTVTQSLSATSTARNPYSFNQAVPIKFDNGKDKISIHLSKSVGGQINNNVAYGNRIQPQQQKIGALLRFGNEQTSARNYASSGFNTGLPLKSKTEKPRPFSKSLQFEEQFNKDTTVNDGVSSSFPRYHISSARPFGHSETTTATPGATQSTGGFNVYDNVDNMIGVLQEIVSFNAQKESAQEARPGLAIPPSVGPQTLHSLAQYFANELQSNGTHNFREAETKEKLTSLLTAMTVHGYNNLFNTGSTATPTAATSSLSPETTTSTSSRFGSEETNNIDGDDALLPTTSVPELRQLARNFSLALSSYLNDPDNFRKKLESLRPSEPPPLEGSDNPESSTTEDELLNFSDADLKPSTTAPIPSATWGAILAVEAQNNPFEDVRNSINPDLNTADSQSFVPKFNSVQVNEKQGKGFTELPLGHWTSSPRVTQLWQKTLKVNPVSVNDHFETTQSSLEDETTEPELFNQEVLSEFEPQSEISYDLRQLPPLALNSTQVHGILIEFMNHTTEQNRLHRILKKLNTSEDEFLDKMKEIESNPLTKRLILLLISECGANISEELGLTSSSKSEPLTVAASAKTERRNAENHPLGQLVHPHLTEEDQDTRALQLLNSLYTIASRFGRKR